MQKLVRQGIQMVTAFVLMLLLLGGAAPFGQDEPNRNPQPTPTIVR